jgi:hypothetical protein
VNNPTSAPKPSAASLDLGSVVWTKPSASLGNDNCVEYGSCGEFVVWRDSKNPDQEPLVYTREEIRALVDAVRAGELDHLT